MNKCLCSEDIEKINRLIKIRERNNDVAWMLCDYLNNNPFLITTDLMDCLNQGGSLPDEMVYVALLTSFCGLDTENNEIDKQLSDDYFRESIKRLDIGLYTENPYYKNIIIPEVKFGNWELKYEKYNPFEAFVYDDIIARQDFVEIPRVGFFSEEFRFPAVMEGCHEWMAIKPNEINTMQHAVDVVEGRIVTYGLGLGYFTYMASIKETVQHITVVESDKEVIHLFEHYILPQFQCKEKVTIVLDDAFEFAQRQMPFQHFDYAFVDLWHDTSDGLEMYLKMKRMEHLSPNAKFVYWIEESLLSALRWQIFDLVIKKAKSYDEVAKSLSNPFLQRLAALNAMPNSI